MALRRLRILTTLSFDAKIDRHENKELYNVATMS
jgi:hypothetical protein